VLLQEFDGSWQVSVQFAAALQIDPDELLPPTGTQSGCWATAIGVCCLRLRFARRFEEWEFLEEKALAWLHCSCDHVESLLSQANTLLVSARAVPNSEQVVPNPVQIVPSPVRVVPNPIQVLPSTTVAAAPQQKQKKKKQRKLAGHVNYEEFVKMMMSK